MRIGIFISILILTITAGMVATGCSGSDSPVTPDKNRAMTAENPYGNRQLLGMWQFHIDPASREVGLVPLRNLDMHMNALAFMEPPPGVALKIDKIVDFGDTELTLDLKLSHPYPSLELATAFDVCGIVIGHGSNPYPFTDDLMFPGEGEVRLLNPDGYTRWWNPEEFPFNEDVKHQGYVDGLWGAKHEVVEFTANLNGYKYFASDLINAEKELHELDQSTRGAFIPGTYSIRRYNIAFPEGGLVFNYAVDACWAPPEGSGPPYDIPDDFPESSNRPEPWRVSVTNVENGITYDPDSGTASGSYQMSVYIWDWYEAENDMVCAYTMNDELMGMCNPFPSETGDGWAAFNFDLWPMEIHEAGEFLMWIGAECNEFDYQGFLPFEIQGMYIQQMVEIEEE